MPGPVSDSFDPEFTTGANAQDVRDAIEAIDAKISKRLGKGLVNIVEIAQHGPGKYYGPVITHERDLRVIRFALRRALESI